MKSGKQKKGICEAENKSQLASSLRQDGFLLTSAHLAGQSHKKFDLSKIKIPLLNRVSLVEKMLFARHLSVMISAGLSLTRALNVLSKQTKNAHFAKIISDLTASVQGGSSFAESLNKYPNIFSDIFVSMIKVGETGGSLEEVLLILADQMKKDHELVSKVRGAMMYPSVIVVAMIGIGIAMMVLVMPKLISTFEEMGVDLPASTQLIIGISNFLTNHLFLFLAGLLGFAFLGYSVFKSPKGQKVFQAVLLKMPIFGNISKKINSARFARILSSLITSGVPIVNGLQITSRTLKNFYFNQALNNSAKRVQKGENLSAVLEDYKNLYPPMVIQMIQVGEETGTLSEILKRLAEFYEEEVNNITKSLSSIIEPLLMILIGLAVGYFAVSMITPMYSLMSNV